MTVRSTNPNARATIRSGNPRHAASLDGLSRSDRIRMRGEFSPSIDLNGTGLTLRPPTVAQIILCAAGAFVIAVADRAAIYASVGPLDLELWMRAGKLFVMLLALFWAGETLISRQTVLCGKMRECFGSLRWRFTSVPSNDGDDHDMSHGCQEHHSVLRSCVFIAVLSVAMMICWTPYAKMLYPGLIWYDTGDQIAQYFGYPALNQPAGVVSSHHPVLDTIIFGAAAQAGEIWLGGYQAGLCALIMTQAAFMCVILSAAIVYLRRIGAPLGAVTCVFLFFALFPALPIFFMSLVKDSVHAVFFMPWLLMYIEACRSRLTALHSVPFTVGFVLLGVLSALTTATGLYIIVLCVVGLPFLRTPAVVLRCVAGGIAVTVIIAVQLLFPAFVGRVVNVHKEDPNQILIAPMQMTARYVLDYPDDVTAQERDVINALSNVPVERMAESYDPFLADTILHLSLKDPSYIRQYIAVWLQQGTRHPDSYINGYAALESGWFSLRRTSDGNMGPSGPTGLSRLQESSADFIANQMLMQDDNSISPAFAHMLEQSGRERYRGNEAGQQRVERIWKETCALPLVKWLTLTAVWSFVLPLFLLYCTVRRHGRIGISLFAAAPLIWSLLSLLPNAISIPLKPTASRYILWALYVVPVYIAMLRADAVANDGR